MKNKNSFQPILNLLPVQKINVPCFLFHRKAVKKGFDFTLMVVGESGLGKSTLINSMFLTDIYGEAAADPASTENPNWSTKLPQTLNIQEQKVKLVENDVHLALTVVDTPGNPQLIKYLGNGKLRGLRLFFGDSFFSSSQFLRPHLLST